MKLNEDFLATIADIRKNPCDYWKTYTNVKKWKTHEGFDESVLFSLEREDIVSAVELLNTIKPKETSIAEVVLGAFDKQQEHYLLWQPTKFFQRVAQVASRNLAYSSQKRVMAQNWHKEKTEVIKPYWDILETLEGYVSASIKLKKETDAIDNLDKFVISEMLSVSKQNSIPDEYCELV